MKRLLCALLALLLVPCAARAELVSEVVTPTPSAAPTPSATPAGVVFSSEDLIVTLPEGLEPLDEASLAAYDAAAQSDFPDAARTVLAAVSPDRSAAASFSALESTLPAADAAREAAERILGDSSSVVDVQYGENACTAFACAIGEQNYALYFLSNGAQLLVAGFSGLEESEISAILGSLRF